MDWRNTSIPVKGLGIKPDFSSASHQMGSAVLWNLTLSRCDSAEMWKKQQGRCQRDWNEPWRDSCLLLLIPTLQAGQYLPLAPCIAHPLNCCIPTLLLHKLRVSLSFPVSIHLIFHNRTCGFQRTNYVGFVQTKWAPSSWLALLNTRITQRNKICVILSQPLKGKVKKIFKKINKVILSSSFATLRHHIPPFT